jgi:tetratricopeptide (TPR) repeat protein
MRAVSLFLTVLLCLPCVALAGDMCPVARELAKTSLKVFKKDRQKGLSGLIRARKLCPDDEKIAYNLGAAYYQYNRPDLAYDVWSKLARKNKRNFKLLSNLAWLALEFGRLDDAVDWAKKADRIKKDKELLALQLDILFKKGKYEQALIFARRHKMQNGEDKAAIYLAETMWNRFRNGEKEGAFKDLIELCNKYYGLKKLMEAKDKMALALVDDSVVPLPKPLPDQQFKSNAPDPIITRVSDEFLDIEHVKSTLKPISNAYALIVGIHKYKHLKGPRFADTDALQVYRMLVKRAGFKDDSAHIRLRLNSEASVGTLYNDLEWLVRRAKLNPDAKIFFYFSGHGSPVTEGQNIKDGLLVPYEATLDVLNDRTAIPLSYLRKKFGTLKNKNVVCLLDACFSGTGKSVTGMKLIRPRINRYLLSCNKLFISAAAADRPAKEYVPGRQGAFTYFFLKAMLGEGDANRDGWVDTKEAFDYARAKLIALDYDQNPQMSADVRIKLARVR